MHDVIPSRTDGRPPDAAVDRLPAFSRAYTPVTPFYIRIGDESAASATAE